MGFKRPFDDEEFQDLPFKQARQVDYCNKLTQFSETGAHSYMPLKPDITDDCGSSFVKPLWHETFENDKVIEVSNLAKDSDSSAPLSLVSCSSSDENFGSGMAASPEYFQFEFPRKMSMPLKDVHSFYLDDFPRKQIPLGPNHQASIPLWDNHIKKDKLVQYPNGSSLSESDHNIYNDNEEKLMGTCIIPMPDTELQLCSRYEAGCGRSDCGCLDEGSFRCVRQHIMEAREELIQSIGHEKFVNLGFYDMGEEVACKWTKEEERVFHEVVYSRPASLGQNFWKHLAQVFPDRTMKEIVSYYFNVFMLRKRAAQNRSNPLDIDSDDDEFPRIHRGSHIQVVEEDEDSDLESPVDQYDDVGLEEDILEDDDNDDGGGGDFDGDFGDGDGDTTGEGSGIDYSEAIDINCIDPVVKHMNKNAGSDGLDFTVQDDSCMSFEFQADKVDPCAPGDSRAALHVNRDTSDHSKCMPSEVDGCDDDVDQSLRSMLTWKPQQQQQQIEQQQNLHYACTVMGTAITVCPLLSDFGCNLLAREVHPASKFLREWFESRSGALDDGLRLCSHGGCGRPETRAHEFRRCSVCGTVNYCSRGCQALDWKARHKVECVPMDQWHGVLEDGGDMVEMEEGDEYVDNIVE